MIKRTPQEIADFFQCYVAQDEDDAGRFFHAFSEKPTLITDEDFGIRNIWCTPGEPDCISYFVPIECVEVPEGHNYRILYEPRKPIISETATLDTWNQPETAVNSVITSDSGTNQQEANYQKEADSDNKPDSYYQDSPKVDNKPGHLGEVYIHKEYKLISETNPKSLEAEVSKYLSNGWKLFGPPFKGEDCYGDVLLIQPMVRGV